MRHARDAALDTLEPLIQQIRQLRGLNETRRGVFYRQGRAYLHFHEDAKGLFADLRPAGSDAFQRFDVTQESDRAALFSAARDGL